MKIDLVQVLQAFGFVTSGGALTYFAGKQRGIGKRIEEAKIEAADAKDVAASVQEEIVPPLEIRNGKRLWQKVDKLIEKVSEINGEFRESHRQRDRMEEMLLVLRDRQTEQGQRLVQIEKRCNLRIGSGAGGA